MSEVPSTTASPAAAGATNDETPKTAQTGKKPTLTISDNGLDLILAFEGFDKGGWPGGASGCTIGYGYDLGYHTLGQFGADWRSRLSVNDFAKLRALVGITGTRARDRVRVLGTVNVTKQDAREVFTSSSIPRAAAATLSAFPGVEELPPDAAGALISLVFNRGPRLTDTNPQLVERREMRAIVDAVAAGDLMEIANQIRSMCRLWEGKGMDGLIRRREAEAALVESCIPGAPPWKAPKV